MSRTRVLIVDDSAFARKVLRHALSTCEDIEVVGTATDGLNALERIAELEPDVVTLDLVMPGLDGLGVLEALGELDAAARPAVVIVSMSDPEGDLAIRALRAGAIDLVHKPTALATDQLYDLSSELRQKVQAAAAARLNQGPISARLSRTQTAPKLVVRGQARHHLVVVGASTGGPQAITALLSALPKNFPAPIAVVVHIPVGFSRSFAEHLDRDCQIDVQEAADGVSLTPGTAVVARAGVHLKIGHAAGGYVGELSALPLNTVHRPSVDVTFQSAAESSPHPVLGVVLTGMGNDGLVGARAIRERGGAVLTQTESSSVVYGMPRVVWEAGLANEEADIDAMAAALLKWV